MNKLAAVVLSQINPKFACRLFLIGLLALHFSKVIKIIPLDVLIDNNPIVSGQHSRNYAALLRDRAMSRNSRQAWGMDPFLNAGELKGFPFESQARGLLLWDRIVRGTFSPEHSQKYFFFILLLLGPFSVYFAARQLELDRAESLAAQLLALMIFAYYEPGTCTMIEQGYLGNLMALFLSLLGFGLLNKLYRQPFSLWGWISWLAVMAGLILSHPLFAGLFAGPILFFLLNQKSLRSLGITASLGIFSLVALALNWFWIRPRISFLSEIGLLECARPDFKNLASFYIPLHFSWGEIEPSLVLLYLIISAIFGIYFLALQKNKNAWLLALVIIPAGWLAIGAPGFPALAPLDLEWLAASFFYFQIFPAAFLTLRLLKTSSLAARFTVAWIFWFGLTSPIAQPSSLPIPSTEYVTRPTYLYSRLSQLSNKGRILWEDSILDFRVVECLPYLVKQSFLGSIRSVMSRDGQPATSFLRKDTTGPAELFNQPLGSWERRELIERLQLYNVSYVVVSSLQARSRFDRFPKDFQPVNLYEEKRSERYLKWISFRPYLSPYRFRVYKVLSYKPTYFLKGSGRLTMNFNRLEISDASAGDIVLKFHWNRLLKTSPDFELRPVLLGGDPNSFIGLSNPKGLPRILIETDTAHQNNNSYWR